MAQIFRVLNCLLACRSLILVTWKTSYRRENFLRLIWIEHSLAHWNKFISILSKTKSLKEAIRTKDQKLFEVEIKVLIVSVVLGAMSLYGFCDIITASLESDVSNLETTYRRQTGSLIVCLFLYLAPVMVLFSKKFEVL